jgi:hypothetical protein
MAMARPYPAARPTRQNAAQRGGNGPLRGGVGRCQWCKRKLRGRQQSACSASCRSALSRCKHRTAVRALTDVGMPRHVADRLIAAVGLHAVEDKLNALGWSWQPAARAWVRENPAILQGNRRRAA